MAKEYTIRLVGGNVVPMLAVPRVAFSDAGIVSNDDMKTTYSADEDMFFIFSESSYRKAMESKNIEAGTEKGDENGD